MPRFIQHPTTGKLIPAGEYFQQKEKRHFIQGDIDSFVSPIDGSVISDRKQLSEHMKRHGVVQAGEFTPEHYARKAKERARLYTGEHSTAEKQARGEEINRIIDHHINLERE